MKIELNQKILDKNSKRARQNRHFFAENNILCVNMISSPGSGKTTILSRTVTDLAGQLKFGVIEGDIQTDTDADKIRAAGAQAVQIETKGACHLSAQQVTDAMQKINPTEKHIIFIENVGNLVCPSAFDLGENARAVVLSTPEGDDKPIKYPETFALANVILINKIDIAEHISFNLEKVIADIKKVNHDAPILQLSALTGQGMNQWYDWLKKSKTP
jgi:hydrogenase nickel incorporation protein HypB